MGVGSQEANVPFGELMFVTVRRPCFPRASLSPPRSGQLRALYLTNLVMLDGGDNGMCCTVMGHISKFGNQGFTGQQYLCISRCRLSAAIGCSVGSAIGMSVGLAVARKMEPRGFEPALVGSVAAVLEHRVRLFSTVSWRCSRGSDLRGRLASLFCFDSFPEPHPPRCLGFAYGG